ncbi:hypothetical protein [Streptomyces palmae]|uniref:Uncharacterized protein n=1 Tax=Streptomyces palmae TaxID=1701085 RepID=A0A4Z0H2L4_9ACTN|nr:hypothetical protein [Streptomyces palmae]TGB03387.1 hypothetical protein E4099_19440 [Streptomyces palmae]
MNARIAAPARHRHRPRPLPFSIDMVLPPVLGLCYGAWVGWVEHNHGTELFRSQMIGLIAAGLLTALCYGIAAFHHHVISEVRAVMYGAVFGLAMGFGYSVAGSSVLKSSLFGLMFAVIGGVFVFFRVHTREPVSRGDLSSAPVQDRDRRILAEEQERFLAAREAAQERRRPTTAAGPGRPGVTGRAGASGARPGLRPSAARSAESEASRDVKGSDTDLGPTSTGQ